MMKNRPIRFAFLLIMFAAGIGYSQNVTRITDRIIVFPFENASNQSDFNWVGESFALSLSELLKVPGLDVVSNGERKALQQKLRIPLSSLPSLATSLKLAREAGATLLVTGKYNILPGQGDLAATINVTVKIVRVNEGRYLTEEIDGKLITRDINLNDALGNLQTVQGQIAYQILYQRDKLLPFSQNQLIEAATKVPARAFEAYIKGLLTQAPETRENFLKNAIRLYNDANPDSTFVEAALELGHFYMAREKYPEAIEAFERVLNAARACRETARAEGRGAACNDESFAEASFYAGLIYWRRGNFEQALGVLRPLAEELKLTSVYNTIGAIAVQASRAETKNAARGAALLTEGSEFLKTAAESEEPPGPVHFNYALTLLLSGNFTDASGILKSIIAANPRDGEAYYLLAKALSAQNDESAAAIDNQARLLLASGNRYANLEKEWAKSRSFNDIQLRVVQPSRRDFVSVVLSRKDNDPQPTAVNETEKLLEKARSEFKAGRDEEAIATVRRILAGEPMNAESYLILGKIHLRRGDRDQAASALKTAIFWDNKLIDAYIALAKIDLERRECLQVKTYVAQALEIDPDNPEVAALQRQADRCSK
ncbi:MAG: tetratricopeptide repeat protein [Pyrinomonadaceae bacterium]